MLNIRKLLVVVILLSTFFQSNAQKVHILTLHDAIKFAQQNSIDFKIALNSAKSNYWNYQAFQAGFLPKLSLNGRLPNYYRAINQITLPTGENAFVEQNVASSHLNLDLSQNIGFTGGRISISSSSSRIDNFGEYRLTTYASSPLFFSYLQNSLLYNAFRWQKKIEPLRYKEAQKGYIERVEDIGYSTVDRYFQVLLAHTQLRLDQQNLRNIDTLVKVTNDRSEIGTVQLNEVLQAKISLLNARKAASNSLLNLEVAQQSLIRYLNLGKDQKIELLQPDNFLIFDVDPIIALEQALQNRKSIIEFQRRRLEAEQEIARIKSETGPVISFRTDFGLSQRGNEFIHSYMGLLNAQTVELGFNIPLLDWGVNKSSRKRAEANLELENNLIEQEELAIEQEIYLQSMKWGMQQEQLEIASQTKDMAEQRYSIAKQKYALGSISYTDFNNAQLDKDRAALDYISTLRSYWSLYYLIRKLTLFDFQNNREIALFDLVF